MFRRGRRVKTEENLRKDVPLVGLEAEVTLGGGGAGDLWGSVWALERLRGSVRGKITTQIITRKNDNKPPNVRCNCGHKRRCI